MTTDLQQTRLRDYEAAVLQAPEALHLTSERDRSLFRSRHINDALALLASFPREWREKHLEVTDIGAGNGIPGIVLAIMQPNWHLDLIESNNKKCGFLDTFCKLHSIPNVTVMPTRAELAGHGDHREASDIVTARAVGPLAVALELTSPLVKVGGHCIVPHGTNYAKDVDEAKKAVKELNLELDSSEPYWESADSEFHALVFRKVGQTPLKYPRAVGIPAKRPL